VTEYADGAARCDDARIDAVAFAVEWYAQRLIANAAVSAIEDGELRALSDAQPCGAARHRSRSWLSHRRWGEQRAIERSSGFDVGSDVSPTTCSRDPRIEVRLATLLLRAKARLLIEWRNE